jgi:hypothetical protein
MPANVVTGAKAIIKLDGVVAGYATGISVTEVTLNGRVDSLGFVDTREIVPIGRQVSATCNFIRIFQTSDSNGPVFEDETTTDEALVLNTSADVASTNAGRTDEVLLKRPFDLEIIDTTPQRNDADAAEDEKVIYTVKGCLPAAQSIVVDRGSLMGVQVTLDATHLIRHRTDSGEASYLAAVAEARSNADAEERDA